MAPHDAARCWSATTSTIVPIDEIDGRIAATLFVVYPPGIATHRARRAAGPSAPSR